MNLAILVSLILTMVAFVWGLHVWWWIRAVRARARLRGMLEEQGHRIRRMELRWLTRGPFTELPPAGMKGGGWLYRILTEDVERKRRVAWIRYHLRWPWQDDRWELRWDESGEVKPRGLPTMLFMAPAVAGVAVAIFLIFRRLA